MREDKTYIQNDVVFDFSLFTMWAPEGMHLHGVYTAAKELWHDYMDKFEPQGYTFPFEVLDDLQAIYVKNPWAVLPLSKRGDKYVTANRREASRRNVGRDKAESQASLPVCDQPAEDAV